jgi:hypothetical protein
MAGVKGKSGRRPLSVASHILNGTFRPDRHGPRPVAAPVAGATALQADVPPMSKALTAGLGASGLTFLLDVWGRYDDWAPAHLILLRQAGELVDSLADYATIIARDGALLTSSRGKIYPHPLLRVQSQARGTFLALLAALDLKEE